MAPTKSKNPKKTAQYYAKNPKAKEKKKAYDTKYHKSAKRKKYRANLQKERVRRGIDGKGGNDVSHKKSGGYTVESPSKNRARNRGKI